MLEAMDAVSQLNEEERSAVLKNAYDIAQLTGNKFLQKILVEITETELIAAVNRGDIDFLSKADPLFLLKSDASGKTPLHYAVDFLELASLIIKINPHASLIKDNEGNTPFQLAVKKGDQECCDLMLQGFLPGNESVLKELLKSEEAVLKLIFSRNNDQQNALYDAIKYKQKKIIKLINEVSSVFQDPETQKMIRGLFTIPLMDANTENNPLLLACTSGDNETIDEIFQSFNEEFYHLHNNYLSEELFHQALGTTLLAGNSEVADIIVNHAKNAKIHFDIDLHPQLFINAFFNAITSKDTETLKRLNTLMTPQQTASFWKDILNAELSNELDIFEILIEAGFGSQFLFYLNQEEFLKLINVLTKNKIDLPSLYSNARNPLPPFETLQEKVFQEGWMDVHGFLQKS
jgi:ankyrin repeat protein